MSPRYFKKIDRSKRNTITIEAEGPWSLQGPNGVTASGGPGLIVITFDLDPAMGNVSSLAAIIIDPDPGGGTVG